jgi:hypothetical protein
VNGNLEYFEAAVRDLALTEAECPGWAARLLTYPVRGLENLQQLIDTLTTARGAIKVFMEIAPLDSVGRKSADPLRNSYRTRPSVQSYTPPSNSTTSTGSRLVTDSTHSLAHQ